MEKVKDSAHHHQGQDGVLQMLFMKGVMLIIAVTMTFRQVDGILAVHEFHIWQLAGDRIIASAHVGFADVSL